MGFKFFVHRVEVAFRRSSLLNMYFWEFFVELIAGSLYSKGVSFLPEMKGLKLSSFLSVEAISWIKQHLDGISSNEQAIHLCQVSALNLWLCAFGIFLLILSDTCLLHNLFYRAYWDAWSDCGRESSSIHWEPYFTLVSHRAVFVPSRDAPPKVSWGLALRDETACAR